MISPNELRIGNLISGTEDCIKFPMPLTVTGINSDGIEVINGDIGLSEYYGEQLTEEWLLKFGFKKKETPRFGGVKFVFQHPVKTNSAIEQYVLIDERFDMLYESGRVRIKYVHQLQNLYFALTNKELKDERSVATGDD